MIIGVDFDGTCVTHEYPKVGRDIGAQSVLSELISNKHEIIIWTIRSGTALHEAVLWFNNNNIPLFGINTHPLQSVWTKSPKAYAHLYIDDAALGIPLIYPTNERPYVDWKGVRKLLVLKKIIIP